jgi:hypothetical protein
MLASATGNLLTLQRYQPLTSAHTVQVANSGSAWLPTGMKGRGKSYQALNPKPKVPSMYVLRIIPSGGGTDDILDDGMMAYTSVEEDQQLRQSPAMLDLNYPGGSRRRGTPRTTLMHKS